MTTHAEQAQVTTVGIDYGDELTAERACLKEVAGAERFVQSDRPPVVPRRVFDFDSPLKRDDPGDRLRAGLRLLGEDRLMQHGQAKTAGHRQNDLPHSAPPGQRERSPSRTDPSNRPSAQI